MAIFQSQLANVVEWNEYRDDVIFWKWSQKELKKGSRLIIHPGQDAIFLYNGRIEGIFKDEGNFEIESEIVPFLSTLKGFKFGFNSGIRAEIVFINTKEFTVKWGTKNPLLIPAPGLPGGMPIRSFGTFNLKTSDYVELIDKIAGIKGQFTVDDVKERVTSVLDSILMRQIVKQGKDMFDLQINSNEISQGICSELDYEMLKIGLSITGFNISAFNYPEEIQKRINQSAGVSMVGDIDKMQRVAMIDALGQNGNVGDTMNSAIGMMAGMQMAREMIGTQTQQTVPSQPISATPVGAKFCSNCGFKLDGVKFCPECGQKIG